MQNVLRLLIKIIIKKGEQKQLNLFSNWNPNQYTNGEENLMMKYGEKERLIRIITMYE